MTETLSSYSSSGGRDRKSQRWVSRRTVVVPSDADVVYLREEHAAEYLGRAVRSFRKLPIAYVDGRPTTRLKGDRLYSIDVLDAWLADHGTPNDECAKRASRQHTRYPRWTDSNGVSRAVSTHPHYTIWRGMMARCHDENNKDFENYGGRGITVWEPWRTNPTAFVLYLDKLGARDGRTVDRKENDEGYEPGNLRWATARQQAANSRTRLPDGWDEPDCVCLFDCSKTPELCPVNAIPWDEASEALWRMWTTPVRDYDAWLSDSSESSYLDGLFG